ARPNARCPRPDEVGAVHLRHGAGGTAAGSAGSAASGARSAGPAPLLVAAAVAGPDLDRGAVGGRRTGHVEAESGLDAHDRAVGVEPPLLVRSAVAVPDRDDRTRRGGVAEHVHALAAVHLERAVGQLGPLLVG